MPTPKYPHIHVQLTEKDSNAFSVIGRVRQALTREGVPLAERKAFLDQAMDCASYPALLQLVTETVEVS